MTTPLPWSHSALEDFKNCPRAYHDKRVTKRFPVVKSVEQLWGSNVHKAFEDRQATRTPLPLDLQVHEKYMLKMEKWPGISFTETKIALDRRARPCHYFAADAWYRGVTDYQKIDKESGLGRLVDYKTGKKKEKWEQLMINAIHMFTNFPNIKLIDARFYWTVDQTESRKVWARDEVPMLWAPFIGDLRQYAEAFKSDVWQPRPSGLCNGWCLSTDCSFWRPKRAK